MAWLQLILESDSDGARQASELLEQFGAISVSLSALNKQLIIEKSPDQEEELPCCMRKLIWMSCWQVCENDWVHHWSVTRK